MTGTALLYRFRVLCALWVLCVCVPAARAQPVAASDRVFWGVYGHYVGATHTGGFAQLPGYAVPPGTATFADGTGGGGSAGIALDIPFTSFFRTSPALSRVRLGVRASYMQYDGRLTATESAMVVRPNQARVLGTVNHTLNASMSYGTFDATVGFVPFGGLQVCMGGQIALPLSASFVQTQSVGYPLGSALTDSSTRTLEMSGDIPGVRSPALSAVVGASYVFALDTRKRLLFVPEVLLSLPLTDVAKDVAWQVSSVRAGVSLMYTPSEILVPRLDTVFVRDTLIRTVDAEHERVLFAEVTSRVRAGRNNFADTLVITESYVREVPAQRPPVPSLDVEVYSAGVSTGDTVVLEERVVLTAVPLLSYVFFDSASAELPRRYTQLTPEQARVFSAAGLRSATGIDIYHHVLNIVGERLRASARTTVTLTGCNDGSAERNGTIAGQRAAVLRDYFTRVWGIAPSRIRMQTRDLPAVPSNSAVREGSEENRRVEISFSDPALSEPLWTADTSMVVKTDTVLLYTSVQGTFLQWQLAVRNGTTEIFRTQGTAAADTAEWIPNAAAIDSADVIAVQMRVSLRRSTEWREVLVELPVRRVTAAGKRATGGDREIERYSLLLFPFDGAMLSPEQQRVLRALSARLSPEDRVTITGTTDVSGEEEYNMRLSLQRAQAVAEVIGRADAVVVGAGEDTTSYPGSTPEGRFYSRTVRIEVERAVRE